MFNFFFGSDSRSIQYLNIVKNNNDQLRVITLPPNVSGRGRKLKQNPVEIFCLQNNIPYDYFDPDSVYKNMSNALCVSFGKIFSESFINNNGPIYNIHLSLLPAYRGPSPVETSILMGEKLAGYSIFKIDKNIDAGNIVYQDTFNIHQDTYASDVYEKVLILFNKSYDHICGQLKKEIIVSNNNHSNTKKFIKNDYNILGQDILTAKKMIRAFNVIGPAFIKHNDRLFKIHEYTENENGFPIELSDGTLYPSIITPEGKNKMNIDDYLRGQL